MLLASKLTVIRGDQHGGMHTNERLQVNLITIGSNGPYRRRKRSDLNPSTSVRCEGIGKKFFLHLFEENEIFHVILLFCFLANILGRYKYFFLKLYFFMYFFAFLVFVYVFSVII